MVQQDGTGQVTVVRAFTRSLPGMFLLQLFAGLTLYPVIRFLLLPFLSGSSGGLSFAGVLSADALTNSVRIALESTLWALAAGIAIAFVFERRRWAGSHLTMLVLWLIFITPSYLMTTGWQIFFTLPAFAHGWLAGVFFSEAGVVFLLGLKGLPFAVLAARNSWRVIGAELGDAASLHIKSALRRRATLLQLLLPSAASAFAIVFVENIQEFGIPATLGAQIHLPIVTYAIYERLATTPVDFRGAALLSWQLVGLAVLAALVQLHFSGRYSGALVHGRRRVVPPPSCSVVERMLACLGLLLLAGLGVAVPGANIVIAALSPVRDLAARPVPWDSLVYSTLYAVLAALAAVSIAAPVLLRQRARAGRFTHLLNAISLANMALPGIVLGAAYLIAFNSDALPLYGTPLLLVIAYVAVQVPMLLRFLQTPIEHIHPNLSEAARLHGVAWSARVLDVEGPLLARPFVWGWMMAFAQVFFELPISELLYPAGRPPVGVALVWLNQSLHYAQEARLALAAIAVTFVVAGLITWAVRLAAPLQLAGEPAGNPA
ncbi:MAG: iron ABC transporter permease [Alphaproteobacteria bacterium]|nr:iron ABC transporter permease [Alphaproteobacteria bacterium]